MQNMSPQSISLCGECQRATPKPSTATTRPGITVPVQISTPHTILSATEYVVGNAFAIESAGVSAALGIAISYGMTWATYGIEYGIEYWFYQMNNG